MVAIVIIFIFQLLQPKGKRADSWLTAHDDRQTVHEETQRGVFWSLLLVGTSHRACPIVGPCIEPLTIPDVSFKDATRNVVIWQRMRKAESLVPVIMLRNGESAASGAEGRCCTCLSWVSTVHKQKIKMP